MKIWKADVRLQTQSCQFGALTEPVLRQQIITEAKCLEKTTAGHRISPCRSLRREEEAELWYCEM